MNIQGVPKVKGTSYSIRLSLYLYTIHHSTLSLHNTCTKIQYTFRKKMGNFIYQHNVPDALIYEPYMPYMCIASSSVVHEEYLKNYCSIINNYIVFDFDFFRNSMQKIIWWTVIFSFWCLQFLTFFSVFFNYF